MLVIGPSCRQVSEPEPPADSAIERDQNASRCTAVQWCHGVRLRKVHGVRGVGSVTR